MLLLLFGPDAQACSPGSTRIQATQPDEGAVDAPLDAAIMIAWMGFTSGPDVASVTADGVPVAGTQRKFRRHQTAESSPGFTIWTADAPFPPNALIAWTSGSHADTGWFNDTGTSEVGTFITGTAVAASPGAGPDITAIAGEKTGSSGGTCDDGPFASYTLTLGKAGKAAPDSWLHIYRVAEDGSLDEWVDPVALTASQPTSVVTHIPRDAARSPDCFAIVPISAAGVVVRPARHIAVRRTSSRGPTKKTKKRKTARRTRTPSSSRKADAAAAWMGRTAQASSRSASCWWRAAGAVASPSAVPPTRWGGGQPHGYLYGSMGYSNWADAPDAV